MFQGLANTFLKGESRNVRQGDRDSTALHRKCLEAGPLRGPHSENKSSLTWTHIGPFCRDLCSLCVGSRVFHLRKLLQISANSALTWKQSFLVWFPSQDNMSTSLGYVLREFAEGWKEWTHSAVAQSIHKQDGEVKCLYSCFTYECWPLFQESEQLCPTLNTTPAEQSFSSFCFSIMGLYNIRR